MQLARVLEPDLFSLDCCIDKLYSTLHQVWANCESDLWVKFISAGSEDQKNNKKMG